MVLKVVIFLYSTSVNAYVAYTLGKVIAHNCKAVGTSFQLSNHYRHIS